MRVPGAARRRRGRDRRQPAAVRRPAAPRRAARRRRARRWATRARLGIGAHARRRAALRPRGPHAARRPPCAQLPGCSRRCRWRWSISTTRCARRSRDAGVTTFGQAAALPRDGARAPRRRRARRASSTARSAACPIRAPLVRAAAALHEPTRAARARRSDAEALGFGVQRLVQELATWLTARGLGVTRLHAHARARALPARSAACRPPSVPLRARRAGARAGAPHRRAARAARARRRCPRPSRRSRWRAKRRCRWPAAISGLLPGDDGRAVEVPLVDRLRARLGEDAVRPGRAARRASARNRRCATSRYRGRRAEARAPSASARHVPPRRSGAVAGNLPDAPRPLWLLTRAAAARAPVRDAAVGAARWPRAHRVRLVGRRATCAAITSSPRSPHGEIVWIYRDHRYGIDDGEWFLHGVFA